MKKLIILLVIVISYGTSIAALLSIMNQTKVLIVPGLILCNILSIGALIAIIRTVKGFLIYSTT